MNGNGHNDIIPMEMEPVLGKKVTNDSSASDEQRPCNPLQTLHTAWLLIVAYMEHYQGITLAVVSVLIVTMVIVALEKIAYASTTKTHKPGIRSDYSSAIGLNELQMGKLDHWCLQVSCTIYGISHYRIAIL